MITKSNTKVFIDTNIFLGLYNSNDTGNVEAFMLSLFKNKKVLITTEQANNEYLRNRTRIINEFRGNFIASNIKPQTSSFVRSLPEYTEYSNCLNQIKTEQKKVIARIDQILSDPTQDYIYTRFVKLWRKTNIIQTTDEYIEAAIKRKALGNPPGGDKYTNGDEVIWETLTNTLNCNLIIVSKDHTYIQNKEYLMYEYKLKTNCQLLIYDTVHSAFSALGLEMDQDAVNAEETIRWLDIIIQALNQLGGRGTLSEIYEECNDLVNLFYIDKTITNNTVDSTIRRTIYQHSSDVTAFLGKADIFHHVESGTWELRKLYFQLLSLTYYFNLLAKKAYNFSRTKKEPNLLVGFFFSSISLKRQV